MTDQVSAYSVLQTLAQDSLSSAQQLPAQLDSTPQWKGVGFSLMGFDFVASLDEVSEMLEVPPLSQLPSVHSWVKGVANVRGRLLPVFDLAAFFGGTLNNNRKGQRLLVFEGLGLYVGLWVDHIYGIKTFEADTQNREIASNTPTTMAEYLMGAFHDDGKCWNTFNLPFLAEDSRFLHVAAD